MECNGRQRLSPEDHGEFNGNGPVPVLHRPFMAPDSLDRRRPPHLLGRGPVSHELSGVTHSRDSITVPKSSGFDAPRSIFHASMESSIGPSSHELQSLLFSVNHLRVAARVSSPFSHRLRFRVHSDHTPYMRPERRSRTANRFPTDSSLNQVSMSEHVHRLAAAKLSLKPFTPRTVAPAPEHGE